jgi:hypothetical protein
VRRTHRSARGPGTPPLSATPSTSVGIMLQQDRNAALMQLAAEIPARVLGDLLGLSPLTAVR